MEIQDYLNYVCNVAEKHVRQPRIDNYQIIDGIGEVEIHGVKYQAQVLLEPKEKDWVVIDKPTIRVVD